MISFDEALLSGVQMSREFQTQVEKHATNMRVENCKQRHNAGQC